MKQTESQTKKRTSFTYHATNVYFRVSQTELLIMVFIFRFPSQFQGVFVCIYRQNIQIFTYR